MMITEQYEEGAALEMRRDGERWRHYLCGQPVADGMELELRVSKHSEVWLSGMYEWNGDPMKNATFVFFIETGIVGSFGRSNSVSKLMDAFAGPRRKTPDQNEQASEAIPTFTFIRNPCIM